MTVSHQFGGRWTEEKLKRLRKYLHAYTTIFTKNIRASMLHTIYVDAFAGTGYRNLIKDEEDILLPFFEDEDVLSFQKGSAYIALETEPSFKEYLFIEQSPDYAKELEKLKFEFSDKSDIINIVPQETNSFRFFGNSRDEPGVLKRSFSGLWQAKRPASRATDPVFLPGSLDASQGQKQAKAPLQHS